MGLIPLECANCSAQLEVDEDSSSYTCSYCNTQHERDYSDMKSPTPRSVFELARRYLAEGKAGKAVQLVEQGLAIDPHDKKLLQLEVECNEMLTKIASQDQGALDQLLAEEEKVGEAEEYHLKATFILDELQANMEVYNSNSALSGANPANVDLALQYVNRSLEITPSVPAYWNTKALLLAEGKKDIKQAISLLEMALEKNPKDITIKHNLETFKQHDKTAACFVATAAYGSPLADEVDELRRWRDAYLLTQPWGRRAVDFYYRHSPIIASWIARHEIRRAIARALLWPVVKIVGFVR